jgi:hypothetical protein
MTGKLHSDVSDTDDMNADEVMMVFHSLSRTHSLTCLLTISLSRTQSYLTHLSTLPYNIWYVTTVAGLMRLLGRGAL